MNSLQKERVATLRGQGDSYAKIAGALGVSINTIKSYCRRKNIGAGFPSTGEKGTEMGSRSFCRQCGAAIIQQPGRKTRRFCSDDCRAAWWKANPDKLGKRAVYSFTCARCGTVFTAYGNKGRKYCSHACYVVNRFGKGTAL